MNMNPKGTLKRGGGQSAAKASISTKAGGKPKPSYGRTNAVPKPKWHDPFGALDRPFELYAMAANDSENGPASSSSSSSSGCYVGANPLPIFGGSLLPPGRVCHNAQEEYRRAKWQIYVEEGHTASVTLTLGPVVLIGSTTGLKNGDIFYVEAMRGQSEGPYNGGTYVKPGGYLMRIQRDDGICYSLNGEFSFAITLEQEELPFRFDGATKTKASGFLPGDQPNTWYRAWLFWQTLWGFGLDQRVRVAPTRSPRTVLDTHEVTKPYYLKTIPDGMYAGCLEFSLNATASVGGSLTAVAGLNMFASGISVATFSASMQVTGLRSFDGSSLQSVPATVADATNGRGFGAIVTRSIRARPQWFSATCVTAIKQHFTVHYISRLELNMSGNGMNLGWAPSGTGDANTGGFVTVPSRYSLTTCP